MARTITPAPGTPKSVQRGVITIAANTSSQTATINAVNPVKARLSILGAAGDTTTGLPYLTLTNATTITAQRMSSPATTAVVSYEIQDWY